MSEQPNITSKIIERAKKGDSDAVTAIYQAYVSKIFRYVSYRVGSDKDAEDITGEVFVNMVEGLSSYEDRGIPFEAWLYRIAGARVADFHRKRGRREIVALDDNMPKNDEPPEQLIVDAQELGDLKQALAELREDEQMVLIMRFVERKSHQEVAETTGKSVSAVKSIQHRALVKLASLMGADGKGRHYLRGQND